jgi:hypothetical protein
MIDASKNEEGLTLAEEGVSKKPPVGNDLMGEDGLSLEDIDLEFADDGLSGQGKDNDDDIIELTEMVEEPVGYDGVEDIVFEPEEDTASSGAADLAKEEEEIIELVEAVEDESPMGEDRMGPEDFTVDDLPEEDLSEQSFSDASEDIGKAAVKEELGLEMPENGPAIPGFEEEPSDLDLSMEQEDTSEEAPVQKTAMAPHPAEMPGEADVLQAVPEEKIEEIIVRVVKDVIEKKADQILLEVAETAIQREIEKIKNLL